MIVRLAVLSGLAGSTNGGLLSAISRHLTSTEAGSLLADSQDGVLRKSSINKQHGRGRSGASSAG